MTLNDRIIAACKERRNLSDKLRFPYMRHQQQPLRAAIMQADVQIMAMCKQAGISEAEAYQMSYHH